MNLSVNMLSFRPESYTILFEINNRPFSHFAHCKFHMSWCVDHLNAFHIHEQTLFEIPSFCIIKTALIGM